MDAITGLHSSREESGEKNINWVSDCNRNLHDMADRSDVFTDDEMSLGDGIDIEDIVDGGGSGDDIVETPVGFPDLCLNPRGEGIPMNPLCPVCEEEITPVESECERRYECGCDILREFTFD
jgi:hypothetical protein